MPTSTSNTGEQWDMPNAWAPLQHLIVRALEAHSSSHPEAGELAYSLAEKWIRSNWQGYNDVHAMFEKVTNLLITKTYFVSLFICSNIRNLDKNDRNACAHEYI